MRFITISHTASDKEDLSLAVETSGMKDMCDILESCDMVRLYTVHVGNRTISAKDANLPDKHYPKWSW